jgi:predicted ATP-grasp superfamily ATP-dependent carboligase
MAIVRSLGSRGIDVVAADASRRSPAFRSRYISERVVYPSPVSRPREAVDTLVDEVRERAIDLVIPVGEEFVLLLSAARDRFGDSTRLALPDADAFATTHDKLATVELARRLGIPAPRTVLVTSAAEAVDASEAFAWPIVLKPQASRAVRAGAAVEAFGVAYAADVASLEEQLGAFEGRCAVLLQEYERGEGHGVGLLMDRGRPLLAFQHRRLREVPFTGGPSSYRESVALDPRLYELSVRILGALTWTGPAMVEFKVRGDDVSLMEINGRLWGSLPLAVKSGVDFPGRIVDLYLSPPADGPPPTAITRYEVGVRSRNLSLELGWIASVLAGNARYPFLEAPRRREAVSAAVELLNPRRGFDILSLDDPLPGLAELLGIAVSLPERVGALQRLRRARSAA